VEQDPSLRLAATWIPGASSPPVVHGANTSVTVEEEGLAGVVVVVGAVVVVLTATPGGCAVVVVGADAPDGDGFVVVIVVVDVVAPDNCDLVEIVVGVVTAVLECVRVALLLVGGLGEPIDEDVDVGAAVDDGAVDMPEGSVPLVFGVVVFPLVLEGLEVVRAGLGTPGSEPGSKAKSNRITIMAKPDAIPIPF
jgi:hypothetical protein